MTVAPISNKFLSRLLTGATLASVLIVGACTTTTGDDGPVGRDTYPEGPYGTAEGDVVDTLEFALADGGAYGFSDIFADEDNQLLLLATAAGWCAACRDEQPALQGLADDWGDKGLTVLVTIFQDDNSQTATSDFVSGWIEQYDLDFPVVLDEPFVMGDFYDASATPLSMIVDVNTMEIVRSATGWDPTAVEGIIEAKLD